MPGHMKSFTVIPAKAGIQGQATVRLPWVPAFAGTTKVLSGWETPWHV